MRPDIARFSLDVRKIIAALEAAEGGTLPNTELQRQTKLSSDQFNAARAVLVNRNLVERRRGRGGPLRLLPDEGLELEAGLAEEEMERTERALYSPLVGALPAWDRFAHYTSKQAFDVASLGKKRTGGKWTRPDILAVGFAEFAEIDYAPSFNMSAHAIEVKTWQGLAVDAVFSVLPLNAFTTFGWVFAQVPSDAADLGQQKLRRVTEQARRYGVGFVSFVDPNDVNTWNTVVEAQRNAPRPTDLDLYIRNRTSKEVQDFVRSELARRQLPATYDS